MRRFSHLLLGVWLATAALAPAAELFLQPEHPPVKEVALGSALKLSAKELKSHTHTHTHTRSVRKAWSPGSDGAITGLVVDASKRDEVVDFFHCVYPPSEDFQNHHGWTGSVAGCNAGTISQQLQDDTLRRINYYRALAGLNGDISFSASKNADCQEAALIMAANGALSHTPPANWTCYTAAGAGAAGKSNISIGFNFPNYGPGSVDGQMEDDGNNNLPVGHRRWLLYSRAQEMGHGSIPLTPSNNTCAAAIWVIGDFNGSAPAGLEQVAWPPEGFVPHQNVWARWSFGVPNSSAGFSSATVTMTMGGVNIPLNIIHRGTGGLGDPTVVWEPSGPNYPNYPSEAPAEDTTFTITVAGISGNPQTSYTYDVTVINPESPGDLGLSGSLTPPANNASTYTFVPLDAASSFETKISEVTPASWLEGAENGTMGAIEDETTAGYALQSSSVDRTGSYSFHLAFDVLTDQGFSVCRSIIPSASSELRFYNLRRWATTTSILHAEVSDDGGGTWDEVWSRAGNGSTTSADWDDSFQYVTESLSAYAGKVVKVRFVYRHQGGSYFPGSGSGNGFYVDDISVTDSQTLGNETIGALPAGSSSFTFTPAAAGNDYYLQLRPLFTCREFGFGEALAVTSSQGLPLVLSRESLVRVGSNVDFRFTVASGSFTALTLEKSPDMQNWSNAGGTLTNDGGGSYTFRVSYTGVPSSLFYRVAGQ